MILEFFFLLTFNYTDHLDQSTKIASTCGTSILDPALEK